MGTYLTYHMGLNAVEQVTRKWILAQNNTRAFIVLMM